VALRVHLLVADWAPDGGLATANGAAAQLQFEVER
jgi:hypothetical protein